MNFFGRLFARKHRSRIPTRLYLESLEERSVPTAGSWAVDTNQDNNNGMVTGAETGHGSLRWCINQANNNNDANTIYLNGTNCNITSQLPALQGKITIIGTSGFGDGAIKANATVNNPYTVLVTAPHSEVSIQSTLISGGYAVAANGGAIYNGGVTLDLSADVIDSNTATYGGGIYNPETGIVYINNTAITNNTALQSGGGIANSGVVNFTGGTNVKCSVNGNDAFGAGGSGGGIYNIKGALWIGCEMFIDDNKANPTDGAGGGVFNIGVAGTHGEIKFAPGTFNVQCYGNSASKGGGFLANNYTDQDLSNWSFAGNSATNQGGAAYFYSNTCNTTFNTTIFGTTSMPDTAAAPASSNGPGGYYLVGASFTYSGIGLIDKDDPNPPGGMVHN